MSLVDVKTALRRDCKVMGVIGGEEQKNPLSFVSLIRQWKSYLDLMKELTLAKGKSGTQLYHKFTTMCQSPKETPQDFLIRSLDQGNRSFLHRKLRVLLWNMSHHWFTTCFYMLLKVVFRMKLSETNCDRSSRKQKSQTKFDGTNQCGRFRRVWAER